MGSFENRQTGVTLYEFVESRDGQNEQIVQILDKVKESAPLTGTAAISV